MYKEDLALNNQQWLICHKTQPNKQMCLYECVYLRVYTCICYCVFVRTFTCVNVYTYFCMYLCVYIWIFLRVWANVCVFICACHCVFRYTDTFIYKANQLVVLVGRVFANGPGDQDSIQGCVIPKILKMVLDSSLLNTQQYKVLTRVKWSNPGKRVAPSPTPLCSSNWKGSLLVALDYSR